MEAASIEQIIEVSSPRSTSESKVKNSKKVFAGARMCVYFKDMECRIPICDMKACEKCNEGYVYSTRVNFIKSMIQKILMFFVGLIIISEL